jgi:hypothetical protein
VSNDSSNIEYNKQTGVLRLRDGTQIKFLTPKDPLGQAIGNEMLPSEIKDCNGNRKGADPSYSVASVASLVYRIRKR